MTRWTSAFGLEQQLIGSSIVPRGDSFDCCAERYEIVVQYESRPLPRLTPVTGRAILLTTEHHSFTGAMYLHDCDLERMIPIFLIVSAVVPLLFGPVFRENRYEEDDAVVPRDNCFRAGTFCGIIGFSFSFVWLLRGMLYSKRIYSANGISHSFFFSHKCFFKTYKNAFKWNASNWDWIFQNYSSFVAASNLLVKSTFFSFLQHGSKYCCNSHLSRLQT